MIFTIVMIIIRMTSGASQSSSLDKTDILLGWAPDTFLNTFGSCQFPKATRIVKSSHHRNFTSQK